MTPCLTWRHPLGFWLRVVACTVAFAFLVAGPHLSGQTPTTVYWEQPNTVPATSWALVLDGVRTPLTATCTGTTYPKPCTAPLPAGIDFTRQHTLQVVAINEWGEAASAVYPFGPPGAPVGVGVRR